MSTPTRRPLPSSVPGLSSFPLGILLGGLLAGPACETIEFPVEPSPAREISGDRVVGVLVEDASGDKPLSDGTEQFAGKLYECLTAPAMTP